METISEPIAVTDRGVRLRAVEESGRLPPGIENLYDLLSRIGAVHGLVLKEHESLNGTPTQPLTKGQYQAFAYAPGPDGLVMHVMVVYPSPDEAEANVAAAQANIEAAEELQGSTETDGRYLLLRLTHAEGPDATKLLLQRMIRRLGLPDSLGSVAAPVDS